MRESVFARDLMKYPVRQLTASTPMRDAAAFLLRHGISGAPVLDEHGQWVGVFTQNDLARYLQCRIAAPAERTLETREFLGTVPALTAEKLGETPVRDFMTSGMFTVFPESTLDEVVHALTTFKVHRVFVIEERKGAILGVITSMDVLRWMDRQHDARKERKVARA